MSFLEECAISLLRLVRFLVLCLNFPSLRRLMLLKTIADFKDVTQDAHHSLAVQSCFSASARWRGHRRRGWERNTGSQSVGKLFGLLGY